MNLFWWFFATIGALSCIAWLIDAVREYRLHFRQRSTRWPINGSHPSMFFDWKDRP